MTADDNRNAEPRLGKVAKTLFGIGCIGFGGGSALIPVFQERFAEEGTVSSRDLGDDVAVACITPGALPVEISAGIGLRIGGPLGSLLGATAVALPGVILLLGILVLLHNSPDEAITQVNYLAIGVSGYILSVIARYTARSVAAARGRTARIISVAVVLLAFALSCGKNLCKVLGITGLSFTVALQTVTVVALTLFLAIWIRDRRTPGRVLCGLAVTGVYLITKFNLFASSSLEPAMIALMAVMAVFSIRGDAREHGVSFSLGSPKLTLQTCGASLLAIVLFALPALFICNHTPSFVGEGMLSSVLSFGGGDAYVAMAEGMFVDSGMITEDSFYSQLVPLANALPGSILCKMLSGMGYFAGLEATGSIFGGLALAVAGFATAIGMSCITFAVGSYFFNRLEKLKSLHAIRRVIGCVVSGLLLTVALGFLNICMKGAPPVTEGSALALILCLALAVTNYVLKSKRGLHPLVAVGASALISICVCNGACMLLA